MWRVVLIILLLAAMLSATPAIRFTEDQCRVLRQAGIDVNDLCPPVRKRTKK